MTNSIRTLIADDEPLARDALRVLLAADPEIEVVAECNNGRETVRAIRQHAPDLVLLDVQMPDLDGFKVVQQIGIGSMPVTIFVTAYDQYALRAFAAHALDYLLKPFDDERLSDALRRAKTYVHHQRLDELSERLVGLIEDLREAQEDRTAVAAPQPKYMERLVIKAGGRIFFLNTGEVTHIEAAGDYLRIHSGNKAHLLRETMNELSVKLNPEKFLRIHRSTIVNVDYVQDIQPLFKGEHILTLKDGTRLKLSRGYRDQLRSLLGKSF